MKQKNLELMVVAGETSGDALGAKLVDEIRRIEPDSRFYGAAGPKMARCGVEVDLDIESWSVTGIIPVLLAVPKFLSRIRGLKGIAAKRKPDVVVLIDFPEFNLKLARVLKRQGHRIVYYVSPQMWAWRKYRSRTIKKYVDVLLTILPFEKAWYAMRGIRNVEFVGNPIVEMMKPVATKIESCSRFDLDPEQPIIAILPGSRSKELRYHLPLMIGAATAILVKIPSVQFLLAAAGRRQFETISAALGELDLQHRSKFKVIEGETHGVLRVADAAAISSGTATLEAAVINTPMVVVYKMSTFDAVVLGPMVQVEHIGLINLVAGKRIATELVQDEFTVNALSDELQRLLEPATNASVREELNRVTEKLRTTASATAAELVVALARGEKTDIKP